MSFSGIAVSTSESAMEERLGLGAEGGNQLGQMEWVWKSYSSMEIGSPVVKSTAIPFPPISRFST